MDRALEIINAWIAHAHEKRLGAFSAQFWTVRDLLEGKLKIPAERAAIAVGFLREKCKESADREHLLAVLAENGYT